MIVYGLARQLAPMSPELDVVMGSDACIIYRDATRLLAHSPNIPQANEEISFPFPN